MVRRANPRVARKARYRRIVVRCTSAGDLSPRRSAQGTNDARSRPYASTVDGAAAVSEWENSSTRQPGATITNGTGSHGAPPAILSYQPPLLATHPASHSRSSAGGRAG